MSFKLTVQINTDDDAPIMFDGRQHCFYGEDIVIEREFATRMAAVLFLDNIKVVPGYKASGFVWNWLEVAKTILAKGGDVPDVNGNQVMKVSITEYSHLQWIYDRMVNVHGENPKYDYMIKFKEIIDEQRS